MVTALPLRGQDRLGSGQGSVQGKQWRSCHCQQREGEHVRLFIIVILIIISFEFDHQYYIAAVIVFCGTFMQAGVYIFLRLDLLSSYTALSRHHHHQCHHMHPHRALKGIHYSVTLTTFGTIGTLEASILMSTLGRPCIPACGVTRFLQL